MYKNQTTAAPLLKPHRKPSPGKTKHNPRPATKSKPRPSVKVAKLKVTMLGLSCFALCLLTVAQFALLADLNYQVNQLERELEGHQQRKEQLQMKAIELESLDRIERYATEELNMKKPTDKY